MKRLEDKTKDINFGRIAFTTLGYGLVGSLFPEAPQIVAPLAATTGFGLSVYDEVKKTNINLIYPALGIYLGGLVGASSDINDNSFLPNILCYTGGVLGGGLGLFKSYINSINKKKYGKFIDGN